MAKLGLRVAIIGGGAIGSSIAWHLKSDPNFTGTVTVIERDPTYARASSALSASSIRQQFSTPLNIHLSRYGIGFLRRAPEVLGVDLGLKLENESALVQKILGAGWVGLFYVDDARSARDDQGRRVVPAVDFVEEHGVRTVFGLGKAYGNGSIAAFVVFTNKLLPRRQVEALVPYVNLFMASTFDLMRRGRIFADPSAGAGPGPSASGH